MKNKNFTAFAATAVLMALCVTVVLVPCTQAQQFSDWSAPANLGPTINSAGTDGCPFISKHDLSLYFASNRPGTLGGLDIWVSERGSVDDPWGPPQNLGLNINAASNELCPTLTIDGHSLYFVSDRPGGCGGQDLYVSRRHNKRDNFGWQPPVNLGCDVNSSSDDFTPSYFEDEETGSIRLYFSSARPGGPGGTDIYVSTLNEDGFFGPAVPVVELNTPFNDQRPNIRRDGLELFFDSNRPGSLGSTDLWVSTRPSTSDPWSAPVSLGPILNSAGLEGRPAISFKGTSLYFMSNRPGGFGGIDLYVSTRSKLGEPDEDDED